MATATAAGGSGGPPPAPKGFTLVPGYCVGDSSTTSLACLIPPQQITFKRGCKSEEDCFKLASTDCLADDTCSAFAYSVQHQMYETFTVGLANVVANKEWTAYAKPLVCCQCEGGDSVLTAGGVAVDKQQWRTGLHHWHFEHKCATNGNREGPGGDGKAVLFCMKTDTPQDPCPMAVEIEDHWGSSLCLVLLLLGVLYLAAGIAFGHSRGRGGGPGKGVKGALWAHPHHKHMLEVIALCNDGLAFTTNRVRGRKRTLPQTAAAAALRDPLAKGDHGSAGGRSRRKSDKSSKSLKGKSKAKQTQKQVGSASPTATRDDGDTHDDIRGRDGNAATLKERRDETVHSSQAKIKVTV